MLATELKEIAITKREELTRLFISELRRKLCSCARDGDCSLYLEYPENVNADTIIDWLTENGFSIDSNNYVWW